MEHSGERESVNSLHVCIIYLHLPDGGALNVKLTNLLL